jgi:hypothetical protein
MGHGPSKRRQDSLSRAAHAAEQKQGVPAATPEPAPNAVPELPPEIQPATNIAPPGPPKRSPTLPTIKSATLRLRHGRKWMVAFWRWIGGRWQWGTLFAGGCTVVKLFEEYGAGCFLFSLAAMAAGSKLSHWQSEKLPPRTCRTIRSFGYVVVVTCFSVVVLLTFSIKGDNPWSRLPAAWIRFEYWASDTELLEPARTLLSLGVQGKVEIGSSGIFLNDAGSAEAIKKFLGESHLCVEQIGDRLKVSTEIMDSHGELLGKLVHNKWSPGKHPPLFDLNYTHDALEVLDMTGDVVFQIVMLPDRIRLQGKWYYSDGRRTTIMQGYRGQPTGGALIAFAVSDADEHNPMRPYRNQSIPRLFLYPSSKHLGELAPVVILGN